jgi:hypothetical protein
LMLPTWSWVSTLDSKMAARKAPTAGARTLIGSVDIPDHGWRGGGSRCPRASPLRSRSIDEAVALADTVRKAGPLTSHERSTGLAAVSIGSARRRRHPTGAAGAERWCADASLVPVDRRPSRSPSGAPDGRQRRPPSRAYRARPTEPMLARCSTWNGLTETRMRFHVKHWGRRALGPLRFARGRSFRCSSVCGQLGANRGCSAWTEASATLPCPRSAARTQRLGGFDGCVGDTCGASRQQRSLAVP